MRGDDARDRLAREQALPQLTPALERWLIGQAGIDHGPPAVFLGQPDVDMVEGERQGEAHPIQPRHDPTWLALAQRRVFVRDISRTGS
jgi:hypothetical protein